MGYSSIKAYLNKVKMFKGLFSILAMKNLKMNIIDIRGLSEYQLMFMGYSSIHDFEGKFLRKNPSQYFNQSIDNINYLD